MIESIYKITDYNEQLNVTAKEVQRVNRFTKRYATFT